MKAENAESIFYQVKAVKDALPKLTVTAGRVSNIKDRIAALEASLEADGDTLVTINILTTVVEVKCSDAIMLMKKAYETELELSKLYEWRLDKALSYINGEYDADFLND